MASDAVVLSDAIVLYGTRTENNAVNIKLSKKLANGNTNNIYAVVSVLHYMMTSASETPQNVKGYEKDAFWQQTGLVTVSHHQGPDPAKPFDGALY